MAGKKNKKPDILERVEVVYCAPGDLKADPKNARKHPKAQIDQLKAGISKFGFTSPILIRPTGVIIAGHGRVTAAKQLKLKEIPTITVDLPEDKIRALAIADNLAPLGAEWNLDVLKEELADFRPADVSGLGFEVLEDLLDKPAGDNLEAPSRERINSPRINYDIVFDTVEQQQAWFAFIRNLKGKFPDIETVGGRLTRFIEAVKL